MNSPFLKLQKNQIFDVVIEDINYEGFGVAKINGFPIFIESTLPQEEVSIKIVKVLKKFAFGKVIKIYKSSVYRTEIVDKIGTQTGTMPLQHIDYEYQCVLKKKWVIRTLSRHIKFDQGIVEDTIKMDVPWNYRNKGQIPVRSINGVLETGFFKKNSHTLVPIDNYHIQDKEIDSTILIVRDTLRELNIEAYDEDNHQGCIRHIIVRKGHYTGEIMIILVTREKSIPNVDELIEQLQNRVVNLVGIVQNINSDRTNVILGNEERVLYGQNYYSDYLLGNKFNISSKSFYQVNSIQTEKLYNKVLEYAGLKDTDIVMDAYCGIGTITLSLAKQAEKVYAVEIVEDAIKNATENALFNSINNVEYEVGKAEEIIYKWIDKGIKVDVIVVDPPRKGLDKKFIEACIDLKPSRIVYVSCNPATLARDLEVYTNNGYTVEKIQPVDMFPQTLHVETVVLMSRVDK